MGLVEESRLNHSKWNGDCHNIHYEVLPKTYMNATVRLFLALWWQYFCEQFALHKPLYVESVLYVNNMYTIFFKQNSRQQRVYTKFHFKLYFKFFFLLPKHVTCYEQHLARASKWNSSCHNGNFYSRHVQEGQARSIKFLEHVDLCITCLFAQAKLSIGSIRASTEKLLQKNVLRHDKM
jgi:hypothetical protein